MLEVFFNDAVLRVPRAVKSDRGHLLNLSSNELLHPALDPIMEELLRALRPGSVATYPIYLRTIERLAKYHGVEAARVLISAGSDDAIRLVIEAFAVPARSIILQVPNYEGWRRHADLRGVHVHEVVFGDDRPGTFTLHQFRRILETSPPTLVAISNPNGPTGFAFSPEYLAELAETSTRYGHMLVIDECYAAFTAEPRCVPYGEREIRIQSMSKSHGLAGARIASIVAPPPVADYLARFRPENTVSGPAMLLACAILDMENTISAIRSEVMEARVHLVREISQLRPNWEPLQSQANFINFRTESDIESTAVTRALETEGIRVKNTSPEVGLERCIRVTLAHWSILKHFCDAIRRLR